MRGVLGWLDGSVLPQEGVKVSRWKLGSFSVASRCVLLVVGFEQVVNGLVLEWEMDWKVRNPRRQRVKEKATRGAIKAERWGLRLGRILDAFSSRTITIQMKHLNPY